LLDAAVDGENLILPCETAAKVVIPAIRAYIARELVVTHDLKQEDVAKILGITQSAVSKYASRTRGNILQIDDIQKIQPLLAELVTLAASDKEFSRNFFLQKFCETCKIIRRTGLMCPLCKKANASINVRECSFCMQV
jgi:predicted transcriptional regulator